MKVGLCLYMKECVWRVYVCEGGCVYGGRCACVLRRVCGCH